MVSVTELWERVKPLLRQRITFTPDVWRSVEAAIPITVDGTTLVLGLAEENEPLRAHLETSSMMALIREIVLELTGSEMEVAIVMGTTESDWQRYKSRQAYLLQLVGHTAETAAQQMKERDWSWLSSQVTHAYTHLPHRQYDYVKAQFLLDWVDKIADFAQDYLSHHPQKQEEVVRELERLSQRMSGMLNLSATVVGLEIERALRARRRSAA